MADPRIPELARQARNISDRLSEAVGNIGETLLDRGYGALASDLGEIAHDAAVLTNFAEGYAARIADVTDRIRFEQNGAHQRAALGAKIGRRDMNGKPLRVGDRVQVHGSERYGDPTGVVAGVGPDREDGKYRVHVVLDGGADDYYTPSAPRVARLARYRSDDTATNGSDATASNDTMPPLAFGIEFSPNGVRFVGPEETAAALRGMRS